MRSRFFFIPCWIRSTRIVYYSSSSGVFITIYCCSTGIFVWYVLWNTVLTIVVCTAVCSRDPTNFPSAATARSACAWLVSRRSSIPRVLVPHAVTKCQLAGIKVIMVTGDHSITAKVQRRCHVNLCATAPSSGGGVYVSYCSLMVALRGAVVRLFSYLRQSLSVLPL